MYRPNKEYHESHHHGHHGHDWEGILLDCLASPQVTAVLSVSRRPTGRTHPKLQEYLVPDFLALPAHDPRLQDYEAVFYCAGVSSLGRSAADYERAIYDTTLPFAWAVGPSPQKTFAYVSGGGTDGTEKGPAHWTRVKGKTENELRKLPFRQAFGFRIGFVEPLPAQYHVLKWYKYVAWSFPLLHKVLPTLINTMHEVGLAMRESARYGYEHDVVLVKDITRVAARAQQRGPA